MTSSDHTPASGQPQRGQVWAHVGQPFEPQAFDIVVIGAGRLGTACALYLRQLAPHRSLLLVEEGGLPNEEGATILAPGIWTSLGLAASAQEQAQWTREQLLSGLGHGLDLQVEHRPLVSLQAEASEHTHPTADVLAQSPEALELIDSALYSHAEVDAKALTYRPGQLALQAAQQAIRQGAHLLLNTHALPQAGGVTLQRLTVTNTHQIVVHETRQVKAGAVVVAAGAFGPELIEQNLGLHTRHGRAYRQYPRLNLPSSASTPVLRVGGLTLRPQNGGFTLIPALHHRDPAGYRPAGGQLTGVPTGLRREVLEDLVELMEGVPALSSDRLEVGRSNADVPGAWVALPGGRADALPQAETLASGLHLLLGGPKSDTLGLATAYQLAERVATELR